MIKKGDTLIEVMLAVGIFSMIAIAVVSVMSGGTSSAQTALETTLAREEIDTQAEALRFIQSSYIVNTSESGSNPYKVLWKKITENAIVLGDNEEENDKIIKFTPSSCADLYNSIVQNENIKDQKAFIINTRMLGSLKADLSEQAQKDIIDKIYYSAAATGTDIFNEAQIYPRLIYGGAGKDEEAASTLANNNPSDNLLRAEGIYVVAVKDKDTTKIVGDPLSASDKTSAFYDFYIRTCWYGSDAERPSTISTVIRLYDPDATPAINTPEGSETPAEPGA